MKNQYVIGTKVLWIVNDFDGCTKTRATITEVYQDHAIAISDNGITLWIDEDNENDFTIIKQEAFTYEVFQ